MVKEFISNLNISKLFWITVGILVMVGAFNLKIFYSSHDQSEIILQKKRANYTKELTEKELNDFINVYTKFKEDGMFKHADMDYILENPDAADWTTGHWFSYQAWDIGRFAYIKKRVLEALSLIKRHRQAAGLASQLEDREDESSQQMLEYLKNKAEDNADFNEKELKLVQEKSEILKKLLN